MTMKLDPVYLDLIYQAAKVVTVTATKVCSPLLSTAITILNNIDRKFPLVARLAKQLL